MPLDTPERIAKLEAKVESLQDDIKEGHNRGIKEIPAFFVNDVQVTLKPTFANLSAAIQAALRKSKSKASASKTKTPAKAKQRA